MTDFEASPAGDVRLDEAQAASLIRTQFPALASGGVAYLGEGCDSRAFEVNGEWVFRFPKRADVAEQLAIEARMLPVLARQSPLPVPTFSFHGKPSAAYPFMFAGYRKLPGTPAIHLSSANADVVLGAARFLSWLHRLPAGDAASHGVEPRAAGDVIDELRSDVLDDFERLPEAIPDMIADAPLDEWRAFFEAGCAAPPPAAPAVLIHGDFAAEHILHDPEHRRLTGIIDWSEMALSDPAIDLAAFYHWGGQPCFDAALAVYGNPIDGTVETRARFVAACRGVGDVVFGLEMGRREYVEAGARALAMCLGGRDGWARK